jgi:hypothetical protein
VGDTDADFSKLVGLKIKYEGKRPQGDPRRRQILIQDGTKAS